MKFYFVRHTDYYNPKYIYAFHLPFYLNENGRKQAKQLGEWFVSRGLQNLPIISSNIVRAVQTAEIIASQTNSMVTVDPRLQESSCPELQGKVHSKEQHWIEEEDNRTRESQKSLRSRMKSIYNEKIAENKDIIFVSHGDPLTILYYDLLNEKPPRYFWDPENAEKVIRRGEIMEVWIENGELKSVKRHLPLGHL